MLLFNPFVVSYLLCVVAFFIAACWPARDDTVRQPRSDQGTGPPQPLSPAPPSPIVRPAVRGWGRPNQLPIRELEAIYTAEYAARASHAIKRIRLL